MRKNNFLTGFIIGLIAPVFGSIIFYLIFFGYIRLDNFINHVMQSSLWVSVLSIGVILNLGIFMLFIKNDFDKAARGVLGATFVYAFIVLIFKI